MKTLRRYIHRTIRRLGDIPIVERILLVFMAMMFVQFAIILTGGSAPDMATVDVVTRSVAATIFGYFIGGSVNAAGLGGSTDAVARVQTRKPATGEQTTARIGFRSDAGEPAEPAAQSGTQTGLSDKDGGGDFQIWVVGGMGFMALLLMFIVRNVEAFHGTLELESSIATLSQLRDFAAGSIGFLVSSTKKRKLGG